MAALKAESLKVEDVFEDGKAFLGRVLTGDEYEPFRVQLMKDGLTMIEFILNPRGELPTGIWHHESGSYEVKQYNATQRVLQYEYYVPRDILEAPAHQSWLDKWDRSS